MKSLFLKKHLNYEMIDWNSEIEVFEDKMEDGLELNLNLKDINKDSDMILAPNHKSEELVFDNEMNRDNAWYWENSVYRLKAQRSWNGKLHKLMGMEVYLLKRNTFW